MLLVASWTVTFATYVYVLLPACSYIGMHFSPHHSRQAFLSPLLAPDVSIRGAIRSPKTYTRLINHGFLFFFFFLGSRQIPFDVVYAGQKVVKGGRAPCN